MKKLVLFAIFWLLPGTLLARKLIYSQPFIFAGNLDVLVYDTSNDICEIQGNTYLMVLNYKTGAPYTKPSVMNIEGSVGEEVTISSQIQIGSGAPPLGQPFQIANINKSAGRYKKFVQISTGAVIPFQQQGQVGLKGKFILWIEK